MSDLPLTITAAAAGLRRGRFTSVELTTAMLARGHALQETIAAYLHFGDDSALAAARQADADFASGVDHGPLQGVPIGIKDIIATKDAPTTANSRVLDPAWGQRPDATVIKKLRHAGAVITGKLALSEYAIGAPDPDKGFPIATNPWHTARSPGGSSSGTGAAIAAGMVLGGLGTDTGGSIRGPAAYCSISGLKPTFGRVSKDGCVPLAWSLDNIGPMARSARDCALLLQAMAGYDPLDPCSVDHPVPDMAAQLDRPLAGARIGVPREYFFTASELKEHVKRAVLGALDAIAAAGAEIVDVSIPHAPLAAVARQVISRCEAYAFHEPDLQDRLEQYGQYTRGMLILGAFFDGADAIQANRVRSLVKAECEAALSEVDVLVTPTMLNTAPTFADYKPDSNLTSPGCTPIWNLTGHPALSIPCGFHDGLPIGMQIVGRYFDEPVVFGVADAYQQLTDWHLRVAEGTPATVVAGTGGP